MPETPEEILQSRAQEESIFDGRVLPGYVDFENVDVSSDDYVPGVPFHLEVRAPGTGTTIALRTLDGNADSSLAISGAGLIGVSGYGLICSAVRNTGTTLASGASLVAWHLDA